MSCGNCGRQNPPGALYCLDCGQKLREPVLAVPSPSSSPSSGRGPFAMASGAPPAGHAAPASPGAPHCPRCGVENPPGIRFCRMCGLALAADPSRAAPTPAGARPCSRCGTQVDLGASFCGVCGLPSTDAPGAPLGTLGGASVVSTLAQGPASTPLPSTRPIPATPAAPVASVASAAPAPGRSAALPSAQHPPPVASSPPPSFSSRAVPAETSGSAAVIVAAEPESPVAGPVLNARTDNFGAAASQLLPQLVTILKDGSEGPSFRLSNAVTDLGRYEGAITLPDDPYLSPRHARISRRNDRYYLRDLGSVNGIFYRLREATELHHNDVVLVGQQVLRVEVLTDGEVSLGPVMHYGVMVFGTPEQPRLARLVQLTSEGLPRDVYHLYRDETVVGRESGDVVFTDDVFLSRRHAAFRVDRQQRRVMVRDLGSSNGTLVLFRGEREVVDGDLFRIGHHLFRFDSGGRAAPSGPPAGGNGAGGSPSPGAPR